ncbi:MAG: hypothetical protein KatS3mg117_3045 [Geminicoccaceae bacterium]|nr:MAG: hypothetical protein KatS3mg117_3045 [Geminicoccaceae bacterium]
MPEPLPRRPRSPAQIAAARANGARSRGPRTPEGKARSSQNALVHGFAATVHLLTPGEDPAELERLRDTFLTAYAPDRPGRALLVERLVAAAWKLRRAERLEAALHRLAPRAAPGRLDPDPGLPAALTRHAEYDLLLRYQSRLEGFLLRALRLLETPPGEPVGTAPSVVEREAAPADPPPEPDAEASPTPPYAIDAVEGDGPKIEVRRDPADVAAADAPGGSEVSAADDAAATVTPDPPDRPGPVEPDRSAEPSTENLQELARASAERLLRDGRPLEAARLARLLHLAGRRRAESETCPGPPDPGPIGPLDPATAALWEEVDYRNWVVPPGTGRRPLASLTAEWVCPADRWRVLEELRSVDEPVERARVLAHWARAGLDPGLDHPAYRGLAEPSRTEPAAAPAASSADPPPEPDPPTGRRALFVQLGREAEAYHAIGRERWAREAWVRHARELGVPLPPHADPPEGYEREAPAPVA